MNNTVNSLMELADDYATRPEFSKTRKALQDELQKLFTPLSQTEVVDGFCKQPHDVQFVSVFNAGARFAEQAHGITGETK